MTDTDCPILDALAGRPPRRRPAWFMRQAGRCLPEYRELRKKHSFLELLRDPDVGTEVTLMPMRRFDLDAAILFTDLLVPLEAMGIPLEYKPGPELGWTVDSRETLSQLRPFDPGDALAVPLETARRVRAQLPPGKALLGFVGAPWTLAAYLVEGKGSKSWTKLRSLAWGDAPLFAAILDKLVEAALAFGLALARAGCDAVQVFDSWAGVAEPHQFARVVGPAVQKLVAGLRESGIPVIYFVNGAEPHLDMMANTGADCLGLDWRIDIARAHAALPTNLAVQGNLDPAALFAPADTIGEEVRRIVGSVPQRPYIFNVGHGLDPNTPIAGIEAALSALRALD